MSWTAHLRSISIPCPSISKKDLIWKMNNICGNLSLLLHYLFTPRARKSITRLLFFKTAQSSIMYYLKKYFFVRNEGDFIIYFSLNNVIIISKGERYTNADFKICQYLCLYKKIICWRFHINTPFKLGAREICEKFVYKHSEIIGFVKNRVCYCLRNLQISWENNSRILRVNAKFSGYYFYTNTNIRRFSNLH